MPRDNRVVTIDEVWASSVNAEATLAVRPGENALVFEDGYEEPYSQNSGSKMTRAQLNYFLRLVTAAVVEFNQYGCLTEWDAAIAYNANARVIGSDGTEYKAAQASTGADPVGDDGTNWTRMITPAATVPEANTTRQGTVQYATAGEAGAGTRTDRVASLANIASMIAAAVTGRLLPATQGTAGQVVGHDGTYVDLPTVVFPAATTTARGGVELATQAEAVAGTSNTVVPTVQRTSQLVDARIPATQRLPAANGAAGTFLAGDKTFQAPPTASQTAAGVVEYATAAEVEGANTDRAVTPSVMPIRKVQTYTATQNIAAVGVAGTLHLKAQ